MNFNQIGKAAVVGGVVAIVLEFVFGAVAPALAYPIGFVVMVVGGFLAGWMVKGKTEDAVVAGVVAALIYVILGLFIFFPLVSNYRSLDPFGALVIGIILGAVGGFLGNYAVSSQKSTRKGK